MSGVAIVAVMCHPHKCPHGRCFYCPESDIAPPSYTGEEPAALRGRMYEFHPYVQCFNRLKQLKKIGHPIDKVELIIMGGTFPSRDLCYQEWFVSQCEGEDDLILKAHMIHEGIGIEDVKWKPSIHMPKEAARIFLKVKSVRVERLQDITPKEIEREGLKNPCEECYAKRETCEDCICRDEYVDKVIWSELWNSTIKKADLDKYGWDANPWVWVIEFERVEV